MPLSALKSSLTSKRLERIRILPASTFRQVERGHSPFPADRAQKIPCSAICLFCSGSQITIQPLHQQAG